MMSNKEEKVPRFWAFVDNVWALAVFATIVTVAWLIWIFIEILGGN